MAIVIDLILVDHSIVWLSFTSSTTSCGGLAFFIAFLAKLSTAERTDGITMSIPTLDSWRNMTGTHIMEMEAATVSPLFALTCSMVAKRPNNAELGPQAE
eukprot:TRINITY_DN2825_c0_g1_i2.p1 TRINITY_DN2825_c0_g1~~TRINITY_DN2825_c0_g1_i2.p1  ORF type:complete len:100 (-),score=15.43 TRINITY_DN2825_c0_g1_i2:177-476(-)